MNLYVRFRVLVAPLLKVAALGVQDVVYPVAKPLAGALSPEPEPLNHPNPQSLKDLGTA